MFSAAGLEEPAAAQHTCAFVVDCFAVLWALDQLGMQESLTNNYTLCPGWSRYCMQKRIQQAAKSALPLQRHFTTTIVVGSWTGYCAWLTDSELRLSACLQPRLFPVGLGLHLPWHPNDCLQFYVARSEPRIEHPDVASDPGGVSRAWIHSARLGGLQKVAGTTPRCRVLSVRRHPTCDVLCSLLRRWSALAPFLGPSA